MDIPKFQLTRVYSDGSTNLPQLHALSGINMSCRMGRRGFLLTSTLGPGAAASLLGCEPRGWQPKVAMQARKYEALAMPQSVVEDTSSPDLFVVVHCRHQGRVHLREGTCPNSPASAFATGS